MVESFGQVMQEQKQNANTVETVTKKCWNINNFGNNTLWYEKENYEKSNLKVFTTRLLLRVFGNFKICQFLGNKNDHSPKQFFIFHIPRNYCSFSNILALENEFLRGYTRI